MARLANMDEEFRKHAEPHLAFHSPVYYRTRWADWLQRREKIDVRHLVNASRDATQFITIPRNTGPLPNLFSNFKGIRNLAEVSKPWSPWEEMIVAKDSGVRTIGALFGAEFVPSSLYRDKTQSTDANVRLMGVLTAGFRLTIPRVDAKLPEGAPLAPQQKEEANIILFADEKEPIDLRTLGRVGNYTVAEHWKALKHTDEQE